MERTEHYIIWQQKSQLDKLWFPGLGLLCGLNFGFLALALAFAFWRFLWDWPRPFCGEWISNIKLHSKKVIWDEFWFPCLGLLCGINFGFLTLAFCVGYVFWFLRPWLFVWDEFQTLYCTTTTKSIGMNFGFLVLAFCVGWIFGFLGLFYRIRCGLWEGPSHLIWWLSFIWCSC